MPALTRRYQIQGRVDSHVCLSLAEYDEAVVATIGRTFNVLSIKRF
jgi:hypothetical protein